MSHRIRTNRCEMLFAGDHAYCGDVAFHDHACTELILVVDGHCQTDLNDCSFDSYRGDLLLVPAHTMHNQIDHGPVRSLYIGFESDRLKIDHPKLIGLKHLPWVEQCIQMLVQWHMQALQASPESANGMLQTLLEEIISQTISPKIKFDASVDQRLLDLTDWIQEHLGELITVEIMAQHAGVTASRLFQMFKEQFGQSPMQYVQTQRMMRARQYLKDPYLTIKAISPLCGYQDVNLFVRTFRKHHGKPPGRWREQIVS